MDYQETYERIKKDYKLEKYDSTGLYSDINSSLIPGYKCMVDLISRPYNYMSVEHIIVDLKSGSNTTKRNSDFWNINSIDVSPETKSNIVNYQKLCVLYYINIVQDYIPKDISNIVGEYLNEPLCKIKINFNEEYYIFEEDIYKFPTFFKEPILFPTLLTLYSKLDICIYNKGFDKLDYKVAHTDVWLQNSARNIMMDKLEYPLKISDKLTAVRGDLIIS